MSEASDAAHVSMLIGDYAAVSETKLNVIGGGWQVVAPLLTPQGPVIPPHAVAYIALFPQHLAGSQVALTLTFRDSSGHPVVPPPPAGVEAQPVRIAALSTIERPTIPGQFIPEEVPCRIATTINVPAGIPAQLGTSYQWTLHIDDETDDEWRAGFYVIQPSPGFVVG